MVPHIHCASLSGNVSILAEQTDITQDMRTSLAEDQLLRLATHSLLSIAWQRLYNAPVFTVSNQSQITEDTGEPTVSAQDPRLEPRPIEAP